MWRHIGRHAHCNTACTVDEQVGEAGREDSWLLQRAVIVIREVDSVLVEIIEECVRHSCKSRLGVAHASRWIRVHRPEVALAIDQRNTQRPILCHPR